MKSAFFNWSGGKDSSLALYHVLNSNHYHVKALLTNISTEQQRISMHGVRKELLEEQAKQLRLPLHKLKLPQNISMEGYDQLMKSQLQEFVDNGFTHSIFGDIFLEDLKKHREDKLSEVGLKAVFPLWKRDTKEIVQEFIELGFKAVVVSANAKLLDELFVGRIIDQSFIDDLPDGVDPCGENGEFHSFVYDGPIFQNPIPVAIGDKVIRHYQENDKWDSSFWFCDLLPEK